MFVGGMALRTVTVLLAAILTVTVVAADAGGDAGRDPHRDPHHGHDPHDHGINQQFYEDIIANFTFLAPFPKAVFEVCWHEFFDHKGCYEILQEHRDDLTSHFHGAEIDCESQLCACSGKKLDDGLDKCFASADSPCYIVERCEPDLARCFDKWTYANLPLKCGDFLQCTRAKRGLNMQEAVCDDRAKKQFPSCDARLACDYISNPNPPAPPHAQPTGSPAPNGGPDNHGLPFSFKVFIAAIVTAGVVVVILVFIAVYSRVRRRNVIPSANQQVRVRVADPVRWYGTRQLAALDVSETKAIAMPHSCSVIDCPRASAATEPLKYLLLPCRCEWCGCGAASMEAVARFPTDFNKEPLVRAYPGIDVVTVAEFGKMRTFSCRSCTAPVEKILNVGGTFVEEEEEKRSSDKFDDDHDGAPSCCICLSEPVSVVAMPCGHLSTCTSCAHRLMKGVPRRGANPTTVEVSSQCPKCRAKTDAMTVLDRDQVRLAVQTARNRASILSPLSRGN
jgi:hypothetical protein